ncbi:MAG TPA: hypothetical protein VMW93_03205 [bacterium]|nr:hypothetical protein [bacterium]
MVELRFSFIDVFRAPRLALSAKKIWTQLRALALGLILYNVFVYAAFAVSGADAYGIWSSYYLFPPLCLAGSVYPLNAAGVVLWAAGALAFFVVAFLGMTAVAKITVEQLRGNDFYSRREAGSYVRRHWRAVIFTPVAILVSLAALFGGGLLVGLVGKIPWFGDVVASLSLVPLFLGGLLFVFLVVVFFLSFWFTPPIVATTGDDTFETSFELFSTLSGQPWRLVLYEFLLRALILAGAGLFAFFSAAALKVAYLALYVPMGPKFAVAFAAAWRVMPCWLRGAYPGNFAPLVWLSGVDVRSLFVSSEAALPLPWPQAIAAMFISLGLLVIFGVVVAYAVNVHTVGNTIIYVVLRKKKDDENLLEMYDDELEQAMLALGTEPEPGPGAEAEAGEEGG